MSVIYTYRGNHFTTCVSQIIMLYILNLCSVLGQLNINKTGEKELNIVFIK